MSSRLIKTLLNIAQKESDVIGAGKAISEFCQDFSIGEFKGKAIHFTESDRVDIRSLLKSVYGVDAGTDPNAWDNISRAEASSLGNNEKNSSVSVKAGQVCIKALPGRPLLINGTYLYLPAGAHLGTSVKEIDVHSHHDYVLLIENWENFEMAHRTPLLTTLPGNPLIVYRGDNEYSAKHSNQLLSILRLPVHAFVDFDPKGLIIAQALPYFAALVHPGLEALTSLLEEAGNHDRFVLQKSKTPMALDAFEHPDLKAVWALMDLVGNALPQEHFIK